MTYDITDTELTQYVISKGFDDWNSGMGYASKSGCMDIIQFFINKGADNWNEIMYGATKSGYMDIIQFSINKGADEWNDGISGAAEGVIWILFNSSLIKELMIGMELYTLLLQVVI
jgi:hypothetical protein